MKRHFFLGLLVLGGLLVPVSFSEAGNSAARLTVRVDGLCAGNGICGDLCDPGPYPCATVHTGNGPATCLGPAPQEPE